ncbi:555_t:CDS:1 [Paraglomus brasilianum]|uniref:555_t:CDS:1 n=1 Tax=Paraglomus brasilianum TaxID=144538 RepID=A0A9N8WMF3_9GLOM|nr:555_t:CDS:1 [Paraglomus brasilianum]
MTRKNNIREYSIPTADANSIQKKKPTNTKKACDPDRIAAKISFDEFLEFALSEGYQKQGDPAKRPLNSFMQFQCTLTKFVNARMGAIPRPILTKVASLIWRQLGEDRRILFAKFAEEGEADHNRQHPEYRFHPRRQKPVMRVNIQTRVDRVDLQPPAKVQIEEIPSSVGFSSEPPPLFTEENLYVPHYEYPLFQSGYEYQLFS